MNELLNFLMSTPSILYCSDGSKYAGEYRVLPEGVSMVSRLVFSYGRGSSRSAAWTKWAWPFPGAAE